VEGGEYPSGCVDIVIGGEFSIGGRDEFGVVAGRRLALKAAHTRFRLSGKVLNDNEVRVVLTVIEHLLHLRELSLAVPALFGVIRTRLLTRFLPSETLLPALG